MTRCHSCHRLAALLDETLKDVKIWKQIAVDQTLAISTLSEKDTMKELKDLFIKERRLAKKRKKIGRSTNGVKPNGKKKS